MYINVLYHIITVHRQASDNRISTCMVPCAGDDGPGRLYLGRQLIQGVGAMVAISRNANHQKIMRPVERPDQLLGLTCRALMAHQGPNINSGHWITFFLLNSEWWKVDTARSIPVREDPFQSQQSNTLDVFAFS